MLKRFIKPVMPEFILHEFWKFKLNPRLRAIGVNPKSIRAPFEFLGTDYGGHIVDVSSLSSDSNIYTLGAGLDISFEEELIHRTGCHIHVYDPTPRSIAWLTERFKSPKSPNPLGTHITIHPFGIWSENRMMRFYAPQNPQNVSHSLTNLQGSEEYIEVECINLKTAITMNGHDKIDILKLNVEGAEYAILNSAFDDGIKPKMILMVYDEIHTQGDKDATLRLKQIASRIESLGYKVAFAEIARVTYIL